MRNRLASGVHLNIGVFYGSHSFGTTAATPLHATPTKSGWHALDLSGQELNAAAPYRLEVKYTAPRGL